MGILKYCIEFLFSAFKSTGNYWKSKIIKPGFTFCFQFRFLEFSLFYIIEF